jgi:hypothetical protein
MKKLKIDPEFENAIPHHTEETLALLERDILADGKAEQPIRVWEDVIIDGHNRYKICTKHKLPFTVEQVTFPSRQHALLWIMRNYLRARHHTSERRLLTLARACELESAISGSGLGASKKKVAIEQGVSTRTLDRAIELKSALEKMPDDIRERVLQDGASHAVIVAISRFEEDQQRHLVAEVDSGQYSSLRDCVFGEGAPVTQEELEDVDTTPPDPAENEGSVEVDNKSESENSNSANSRKPRTQGLRVANPAEMFKDALKALGQFGAKMDALKTFGKQRHKDARFLYDQLSDLLEAWQGEARE